MHLNYRSDKPGKCPRCGMTLIPTTPAIKEEFDLVMDASPKTPQTGQPLTLRFAIFNPRTGAKVKEFGLMHGKLFHLFLVSQDLSDFRHHPPASTPRRRLRNQDLAETARSVQSLHGHLSARRRAAILADQHQRRRLAGRRGGRAGAFDT